MVERGFLVPPWYVSESPNDTIMNVCSIIWGCSLCCAAFSATKAVRQSWIGFHKGKLLSAYTAMVWAEWSASVIISVISWLFLRALIAPSFELFFAILCLWVMQMHCILQIIINRVSLVMVNRAYARRLRLGVFLIVVVINISVFCIWIPARLQISETYIRTNDVWDRTEKAIFAVVDVSLNCYFMWTVRTNLIKAGLAKYKPLYHFNLLMVCLSSSLDLILIGSMSLGTGIIYIQFHPLVYLIKLHIELNMAELMAKIVRVRNPMNTTEGGSILSQQGTNATRRPRSVHQPVTGRDSEFTSARISKEMDPGELELQHTSTQYHQALRSDLHRYRSTDTGTTLDNHGRDLERGDIELGRATSTSGLRSPPPSA